VGNVAYGVTGHAYFLEDGVEEENEIKFNIGAFVHTIGPGLAEAFSYPQRFRCPDSQSFALALLGRSTNFHASVLVVLIRWNVHRYLAVVVVTLLLLFANHLHQAVVTYVTGSFRLLIRDLLLARLASTDRTILKSKKTKRGSN